MTQQSVGNRADATNRPVPLMDVNRSNEPLRGEILRAVTRVIDSGKFVSGPDCALLEESMAKICRVKHAVGCASGSDALLLSLMAVDVTSGDEVIVPSFTFFATASAVSRLGARPVFVDMDPQTFNLDPGLIEPAITPATKAIIPVHLFGQCVAMDPIADIARRHCLAVIEDGAQAIGAKYAGRPAGSLGDIGCFSFYPSKNLGGFGDGGMLTTSHNDWWERLRLLRGHGMHPRYFHQVVGINSRLDSIQAAALNVKLCHLSQWSRRRQENAIRYTNMFRSAGLDEAITLPVSTAECDHVWNQYTIRVPDGKRDSLRQFLSASGIETEIYYPVPLHLQECFRHLGYPKGSFPETERAANEVLSLPIFPELTEAEQETVVMRVRQFVWSNRHGPTKSVLAPKFLDSPNSPVDQRRQPSGL